MINSAAASQFLAPTGDGLSRIGDPLSSVFDMLNRSRIRYCVLRPGFHTGSGRIFEVDLLVEHARIADLARLLAAEGYVKLPNWGYAPHHFFLTYLPDADLWIKLDLVRELVYGRPLRCLHVDLAEQCLAHRRLEGNRYLLAPRHELLTLLLHCLLDKQTIHPWYLDRLRRLWTDLQDDPEVRSSVECWITGPGRYPIVDKALSSGDLASLRHCARFAYMRLYLARFPLSLVRFWFGWMFRRLRPLQIALWHPGICLALLGPDGAGKTTLAESLVAEPFLGARRIYMGTNDQSATVSCPATRWLSRKQSRVASTFARRLVRGALSVSRLLDAWIRFAAAVFHRTRGRVVVFDRYTYDEMFSAPARSLLKRLRRAFLRLPVLTPDLVVLLDAPGTVLFARKHEHSPGLLETRRRAYLGLAERLPGLVVVDATASPTELRRRVVFLVWNRMKRRTTT